MASFELKPIQLSNINGGVRFKDGDGAIAEAMNASIEASAYAQAKADQALSKVNESMQGEITLSAYPIGSIFLSVANISPASLFGGVWVAIEDKFLLAAGQTYLAGTTGGKDKVTLTVNELPSHTHGVGWSDDTTIVSGNIMAEPTSTVTKMIGYSEARQMFGRAGEGAGYVQTVGGQQPFDIMPPYLAVYMWERVS